MLECLCATANQLVSPSSRAHTPNPPLALPSLLPWTFVLAIDEMGSCPGPLVIGHDVNFLPSVSLSREPVTLHCPLSLSRGLEHLS